jgi:methylmalonyl-CoA mutase C-terminal domain/subunit
MTLFQKVIALLGERDAKDLLVFGGGIIPEADIPLLEKAGVAKIFTPGTKTQDVVQWVRSAMAGETSGA